jgi:hypothetical protein
MAIEPASPDFVLSYDGPALAEGRMAVGDLAPALLSLGALFQEANTIVNPAGPPVSLEVRAFDRGSFAAELHVAASNVVSFLTSDPVVAAGLLVGFVTDASSGLFALIRWRKGKTVASESGRDDGTTEVRDTNGNVFIAPNSVINIYNSPPARKLARDVVRPLEDEGINELRIQPIGGGAPLELHDDDVEAFEAVPLDELLADQEVEMYLTVVSPVFKAGNKWRLTNGTQSLPAAIQDQQFLDEVLSHRRVFGAGDVLRCRVRLRQWRTDTGLGLRTEWVVVKVMEHYTGGAPPTAPMF